MQITTIGIDLAKKNLQLAMADASYRIVRKERLSKAKLIQLLSNLPKCTVVMEACGTSGFLARRISALGHEVKLLPAQHVKAYVKRNKTDAADAAALIEASRCEDIKPVAVKSVEQQTLQQLHRLRTQWRGARTARINSLRGMLREFGIDIALGVAKGLAQIREALETPDNGLPDALRPFIATVLREIEELEKRSDEAERALCTLTREDPLVQRFTDIPGVGPLFATAVRAAVADIRRFPTARHFSSWMGLTAKEHSSGEKRRLGRISKQGDVYLRTLLVHGARSILIWGKVNAARGREQDRLRRWALETEQRVGKNKATVALANKLARIVWATWTYDRAFNGNWRHTSTTAA